MVPSTAGAVVLVRFPFSDLSQLKLRPAADPMQADARRLSQQPYMGNLSAR
jgi:hypothetical protein